jgi:hypothetical protein
MLPANAYDFKLVQRFFCYVTYSISQEEAENFPDGGTVETSNCGEYDQIEITNNHLILLYKLPHNVMVKDDGSKVL